MTAPRATRAMCSLVLAIGVVYAGVVDGAGREVTFQAADGRTVTGYLAEAGTRPSPAVVLVPMLGRPKDDWEAIAQRLADANVTALAVDAGSSQLAVDPEAAAALSRDVNAAVTYLASTGATSIGVAGASFGATVAVLAAANDARIRAIALVSPSLDYRGIRMEGALRQFGDRPALLLASLEDPYAARSVKELAQAGPGPRELRWSEVPAHGTVLLSRDADLVRSLVEWFGVTLR
jgi:dienelactone hydrolase